MSDFNLTIMDFEEGKIYENQYRVKYKIEEGILLFYDDEYENGWTESQRQINALMRQRFKEIKERKFVELKMYIDKEFGDIEFTIKKDRFKDDYNYKEVPYKIENGKIFIESEGV